MERYDIMYEIMKWIDGIGFETTEYLIILGLLIMLLFVRKDKENERI
jgi:hypothetical protein